MWTEGYLTIDGEKVMYCVKHYEEGSDYGINEGRISKLQVIHKGITIINYDRGWDQKPETKIAKMALEILLKKYN